jgi:hypothetical protein
MVDLFPDECQRSCSNVATVSYEFPEANGMNASGIILRDELER